MKVACISDTHGRDGWSVPLCDVFIHAGDITASGSLDETLVWIDFIAEKVFLVNPQAHMLLVPGNHDKAFEYELPAILEHIARRSYLHRMHVLINDGVEIEGRTFWASPNTPPFFEWHFMSTEKELADIYTGMPDKLDVLITHGPPRGILDPGHDKSHVGSTALLYAVAARNNTTVGAYNIKHHVFGHLHAAGGRSADNNPIGPTFHNVAAVDEAYVLRRGCKMIEI